MDRVRKLGELKTDILAAITQLKRDAQLQNTTVQDLLVSIRDLNPVISCFAEEGRTIISEQRILRSLWFRTMKVRQGNVAEAHTKTFEWIFEDSPTESSASLKLRRWLESEGGFFWIIGKAGSGKSTLMKFLLADSRTRKALKRWSSRKKLVMASFFFWNAAKSPLQKSQEGLLRSLIFEVLRQCPNLIRIVCSLKWDVILDSVSEEEPEFWSREELIPALGRLMQQQGVPIRFCFFVDGLDEYDGDHRELIETIDRLPVSLDIKLCVSSRPWYIFRDAFSQKTDQTLTLEDLTKADIQLHIKDMLEENAQFVRMKARDENYQDLIREIVEKAQGVFLWVFLAVRSLLSGFTNADSIATLQRRLRLLPPTLEEYFQHMFDSVEDFYHDQTARTFQVALEAGEQLSLTTFWFLDQIEEADSDYALYAEIAPLSQAEILVRQEDMRRRLDGRCKGLLEVTKSRSDYGLFFAYKVDFLHRTVRDFLLTKHMQTLLSERVRPGFNVRKSLCKTFLAQMKTVSSEAITEFRGPADLFPMDDLLEDLLYYARQVEIFDSIAQTELLDEAERVLWNQSVEWRGTRDDNVFLTLAIQRNLHLYIGEKAINLPHSERAHARPLLDIALHSAQSKYSKQKPDPEMVQVLLGLGARPNQSFEHSTVWSRFLYSIYRDKTYKRHEKRDLIQIIEMLVHHGAEAGSIINLFSMGSRVARDIILEMFGREETDGLLKRAQEHGQDADCETQNRMLDREDLQLEIRDPKFVREDADCETNDRTKSNFWSWLGWKS